MKLLNGKLTADMILERVREGVAQEKAAPVFAAVLVGNDPASHIYVRLKERASGSVGIIFQKILLPESITQNMLLQEIEKLNLDDRVSGILVQLPLPDHINTQDVIDAIHPKKDVDGFHPDNIQLFLDNKEQFFPVFPKAILDLILSSEKNTEGMKAVVIGNSDIFGRMMIQALARNHIGGRFIHHQEMYAHLQEIGRADIVISACGIPRLVSGSMVKQGAIVIDGGIIQIGEKVVGDIDAESMQDKDVFLSPVPGGVGPVTIACLLENVYKASKL